MAARSKSDSLVADTLADINKTQALRVGAMADVVEPTAWLTTGNLAIDYVTGGGLPLGRSIELYGLPSSGKTTTALQAAAELQRKIISERRDEHILYLDYEHALDLDYAEALGLDLDHHTPSGDPSFLLGQPKSMEQGAGAALKLISTGKIRLSIWDSVASMAPIARLEGEFDQRTAAMNKARLMAGLMLQITPLLHMNNSAAVFINHLMESVEMTGTRPGMPPKVTTPGGKALKYYASLRLEYRQMGNAKAAAGDALTGTTSNQVVGTAVKVKCVKNKVSDPFREAEVRVSFGQGFNNAWSALEVLLNHKVVRKDGAWYRFDDALAHPAMNTPAGKSARPSIQGESAVLRFAAEHPDWRDTLIATASDLVTAHGGTGLETGDLTGAPDLDELLEDSDVPTAHRLAL